MTNQKELATVQSTINRHAATVLADPVLVEWKPTYCEGLLNEIAEIIRGEKQTHNGKHTTKWHREGEWEEAAAATKTD